MFDLEACRSFIKGMGKKQFHEEILRGAAASKEFSVLVSIGVDALSEDDMKSICVRLASANVPIKYSDETEFSQKLAELANYIAARAVSVC